MTRKEHLEWTKSRALEYVDQGDTQQAINSLLSDLSKHGQTQSSLRFAQQAVFAMDLAGPHASPAKVREFIEGFN